jgi:hypothetical protein
MQHHDSLIFAVVVVVDVLMAMVMLLFLGKKGKDGKR